MIRHSVMEVLNPILDTKTGNRELACEPYGIPSRLGEGAGYRKATTPPAGRAISDTNCLPAAESRKSRTMQPCLIPAWAQFMAELRTHEGFSVPRA